MEAWAWAVTAWLHQYFPTEVSLQQPLLTSDQFEMEDGFLVVHPAKTNQKTQYFHGTSPAVGLRALVEGLLPGRTRSPTGVYSYRGLHVVDEGFYDCGCIIAFENLGLAQSMSDQSTRNLGQGPVPSGYICRRNRSAHKRHGADGSEYIHNASDIRVFSIRFSVASLSKQLSLCPSSAVFLNSADLTAMSGWWGKQAGWKDEKKDQRQDDWSKGAVQTWPVNQGRHEPAVDFGEVAKSMAAAQTATLATVLRMEALVNKVSVNNIGFPV